MSCDSSSPLLPRPGTRFTSRTARCGAPSSGEGSRLGTGGRRIARRCALRSRGRERPRPSGRLAEWPSFSNASCSKTITCVVGGSLPTTLLRWQSGRLGGTSSLLLKGAFVAHPSLNRVRLGIRFVLSGLALTMLTYIGVVIFILACFFYLLSTGRTVQQLLQDPPIGIVIPAVVLSILPIAALLLNFLGKLLSLGSSEEIPARWAVVLSLVLDVAAVVASFILFWT